MYASYERYLSGLNHQADTVLLEIARTGVEQGLPLVDAEVGALLRVLALAVRVGRGNRAGSDHRKDGQAAG